MKSAFLILFFALSLPVASLAQDASEITSNKQKASYGIGLQIGQQIHQQVGELDEEGVLLGIKDVLSGAGPRLSMTDLREAMMAYQRELTQERTALGEQNQKAADEFLADNRNQADVVELESGLQYKILEPGEGDSPAAGSSVTVHYRGRILSGDEFDSSYRRGEPASLALNEVISGWQEALVLMQPGAKWEIYIPPTLGYGENGAGANIGPNELLIFEIELISADGQ